MITTESLKDQLSTVSTRAKHAADVEAWATNTLDGIPADLLPRIPAAARAAAERRAKMCQSIGPRIMSTREFGTIGDINWGGDDEALDERLAEIDLEELAGDLLRAGMMHGIMAAIARRDPMGGEVIEPLVGYLEPIPNPASRNQTIGLLHCWTEQTRAGEKWVVRLYDFEARSLREWRGLNQPSDAAKRDPTTTIQPDTAYPAGASMPRVVVLNRYPKSTQCLGEIDQILPLIQSDWSSQLRGDTAEENTAFPQLKITGDAEDGTHERSSSHIIRLAEGGDAAFLTPGDLSQIHVHHDRKLDRLREDANMPGGFLGTQTPSGEALREANQKFIASCQGYAKRLSRLLTEVVADYAELIEAEPAPITVIVNREFTRSSVVENTINLNREGLIEFAAAVRAVSVYYPTWTDAEVEAYIASRSQVVNPEDLRAALLGEVTDGVAG